MNSLRADTNFVIFNSRIVKTRICSLLRKCPPEQHNQPPTKAGNPYHGPAILPKEMTIVSSSKENLKNFSIFTSLNFKIKN